MAKHYHFETFADWEGDPPSLRPGDTVRVEIPLPGEPPVTYSLSKVQTYNETDGKHKDSLMENGSWSDSEQPRDNRCGDCIHFQRLRWHKAIDPTESYQHGGNCNMLKQALGMTNNGLWAAEHLHVQESFGCVLFVRSDGE